MEGNNLLASLEVTRYNVHMERYMGGNLYNHKKGLEEYMCALNSQKQQGKT